MFLNFRIAVNETLENVISLINHKYVLYTHTKKTYTMLGNIVEIYSNEDYDEILSADYEDGFLYYQTYMDFYPANEVKINSQIKLARDVKLFFNNFGWKSEIIAEFEDKINI